MTVKLLAVGKTDNAALQGLISNYQKRLNRYLRFEMEVIPDIRKGRNLTEDQQKAREGEAILSRLKAGDVMILLDEKGKSFTSTGFAKYLQQHMNRSVKRLVLVIGGAYGFSPDVKAEATDLVSLSKMTFSHQMVRLFLIEQVYRACTILRNEPYHHE